jgi:DNA-binding IscR family transcriptional regulator
MKVVSADTTRPVRKPRGKNGGFALAPLEWTADIAKVLNAPDIILVNLMLYLSWKAKGEALLVSKEILRRYGVCRKTKYRVLARLEKAGRIQVHRQNKQAPYVTLLIGGLSL